MQCVLRVVEDELGCCAGGDDEEADEEEEEVGEASLAEEPVAAVP